MLESLGPQSSLAPLSPKIRTRRFSMVQTQSEFSGRGLGVTGNRHEWKTWSNWVRAITKANGRSNAQPLNCRFHIKTNHRGHGGAQSFVFYPLWTSVSSVVSFHILWLISPQLFSHCLCPEKTSHCPTRSDNIWIDIFLIIFWNFCLLYTSPSPRD